MTDLDDGYVGTSGGHVGTNSSSMTSDFGLSGLSGSRRDFVAKKERWHRPTDAAYDDDDDDDDMTDHVKARVARADDCVPQDTLTDALINGQASRLTNGQADRLTDSLTDGQADALTDGQVDRLTDGQADALSNRLQRHEDDWDFLTPETPCTQLKQCEMENIDKYGNRNENETVTIHMDNERVEKVLNITDSAKIYGEGFKGGVEVGCKSGYGQALRGYGQALIDQDTSSTSGTSTTSGTSGTLQLRNRCVFNDEEGQGADDGASGDRLSQGESGFGLGIGKP